MKILLLLVISFYLTNISVAQTSGPFSIDSDTTFWYRHKNEYVKKFNLGYIENDTNDYSFRFWSFGLVIKITINGDKTFGEIIRFVESYPWNKDKKIFSKRYSISLSKASQVRHLIDSLHIEFLPSDKNIVGWQRGLDGIEYFTEFKKEGSYTFKNYWTPTAQGTLKEAIQFQNFVSGLDIILELKTNRKEFQDIIPFDNWTEPGSGTSVIRKPKPKKMNGG